jgi:hypothetical protein
MGWMTLSRSRGVVAKTAVGAVLIAIPVVGVTALAYAAPSNSISNALASIGYPAHDPSDPNDPNNPFNPNSPFNVNNPSNPGCLCNPSNPFNPSNPDNPAYQ